MWNRLHSTLSPATPGRALLLILGSGLIVTGLYVCLPSSSQNLLPWAGQPLPTIGNAAQQVMRGVGVPTPPQVDPSLMQKAQHTTSKSLDVADDAVDVAGTAVDAGGKVVRFGADFVDQILPTSSATPSQAPAAPTGGAQPSSR